MIWDVLLEVYIKREKLDELQNIAKKASPFGAGRMSTNSHHSGGNDSMSFLQGET